jgi:predicted acylesterase/phospholipase RssA
MTIEHLVISGGGPTGFTHYGCLKYLAKKKWWKLKNIKTIYGSSIGAYIGFILSLNFDWKTIDDYLIKRPWEKIANVGPENLYLAFNNKGIVNDTFIFESAIPLLKAKDLSENTTLQELYTYTNIEIHMYTIDLNQPDFQKIDLSYKTHPDMSIIHALNATMALPGIIPPLCIDKCCYIDGAYTHSLPLLDCLEQTKCKEESILVCRNKYIGIYSSMISKESSILNLIYIIINKISRVINTEKNQPHIKNTIYFIIEKKNIINWMDILVEPEKRAALIKQGEKLSKEFLKKY